MPPEAGELEAEEQAAQRELLANVSLSDVERVYADYLEHAFPSYYLSRPSFLLYLARHNILNLEDNNNDKSKTSASLAHGSRLFAAFRRGGDAKAYLTFTDLLLGLAAVERKSKNCRARLELVFRYYDLDRDGMLSVAEFRLLMEHLAKSHLKKKKKQKKNKSSLTNKRKSSKEKTATTTADSSSSSTCSSSDPTERALTEAEVAKEMRRIGGTTFQFAADGGRQEMVITKEVFIKASVFGAKKTPLLKGTEQLVRLSVNPFAQISRSMAARALVKSSRKLNASEVLVKRSYEGRCPSCTAKNKKQPFEIAPNAVRLNRLGEVIGWEPVNLLPLSTSASSASVFATSTSTTSSSCPLSEATTFPGEGGRGTRWLHNLHAKIRAHSEGGKGSREAPVGLYQGKPEASFLRFFEAVKRIARELGAILEAEERVPKVSVPVYIIGDIHGNLEVSLFFETVLCFLPLYTFLPCRTF